MSEQPDQDPASRNRKINLLLTTSFVVLATALIVIDHLIAEVMERDSGRNWSPTSLTIPPAVLDWDQTREGWTFLFGETTVHRWLVGYGLVDVAFAFTYTTILWRWSRRVIAERSWLRVPPRRQGFLGLCLVAGACDVFENLLVLSGGSPTALLIFTTGKWVALIPALLTLVALSWKRVDHSLRRLLPASWR